jgi:hypothetical protein
MRNVETTPRQSRELPAIRVTSKHDVRVNFDDPRWHLAQRIAVSRSIGRSPLLADFLLYVCDRHIQNKASDLIEQRIGVHVFGRSEGYNSNDDNIVRNYARTLRKRVEEYFSTEGKHEELRMDIPRGAYVPVFYSCSTGKPVLPSEETLTFAVSLPSANEQIASPIADASFTAVETPPHEEPIRPESMAIAAVDGSPRNFYPLIALSLVLIAAVACFFYVGGFHKIGRYIAAQPGSRDDLLWQQLFQKDRDTFIVPADSGLVIMQGLTRRPVSLTEYASGGYRADTATNSGLSQADVKELGTRRYTSIVDLSFVARLSRLSQIVPERMMIRYARDLRMDDLRSANAILLGSIDSDPWVELFEQQLNFRFIYSPKVDTAPDIVNQHPLPGEQTLYANDPASHDTYGTIAYLPNLDGSGHVLMIGGLNMAGTQAAGDFLLSPTLMQSTLEHARTPKGAIRPFEILIQASTIAANASRTRVISERIAPLNP